MSALNLKSIVCTMSGNRQRLIISGRFTGNCSESSGVAIGQVLAPKAQDLLTQRQSLEYKKDSPFSYSVVAAALIKGRK